MARIKSLSRFSPHRFIGRLVGNASQALHCGPRGPDGIPDVVLHILAHDEAMIPSPRREGAQVLKERGSGKLRLTVFT